MFFDPTKKKNQEGVAGPPLGVWGGSVTPEFDREWFENQPFYFLFIYFFSFRFIYLPFRSVLLLLFSIIFNLIHVSKHILNFVLYSLNHPNIILNIFFPQYSQF
jgi:hypothetical protein